MAVKKKKKTGASAQAGATKKKTAKPVKKKTSPAKKSKPAAKKAKKPAAKKAKKKIVKDAAKKTPAKKPAKKIAKKKQTVGEGDYAASRSFLKDQSSFVAKNKAKIPALAKEAEKALEGPEGDALRDAEATAAARSRDTF